MPIDRVCPQGAHELSRELSLGQAVAVVVGCIIGSGIFLVPATMMQAVGSAPLVFLAWVVGAALTFSGVVTYAELGAMKPQAGGEYVYIRDAYGPLWSFLYAWTWLLIAKPASIATIATGMIQILGAFPCFSFLSGTVLQGSARISYGQLIAIGTTMTITGINYIGVRKAGRFQFVSTALKVAFILSIVAVGFASTHGRWSNFRGHVDAATGGFAGFMTALVAALWAYDGWSDLNMVAEEVREPKRNVPIALVTGIFVVATLYMLINGALQYLLPPSALATSQHPASDALVGTLGKWGGALFSTAMALSLLATLNGVVMTGARAPFALARDGYFFSSLGIVHSRFRTPSAALVLQMLISICLLLLAGSFRQYFSLALFAEWIFYMVAASTIFVFRIRDRSAERPYRAWGYPVVPAFFIASSTMLLYYTFLEHRQSLTAGILTILAGIPVFFAFKWKNSVRRNQKP